MSRPEFSSSQSYSIFTPWMATFFEKNSGIATVMYFSIAGQNHYIHFYFLFFPFRFYISYKLMKKKVRQYVQQIETGGKNRPQVLKEFSRMLDDQVHHNFADIYCYSNTSSSVISRMALHSYIHDLTMILDLLDYEWNDVFACTNSGAFWEES